MISFTYIATRSIPIVLNCFKSFAISNLVPTPSVLVTILRFFLLGIFEIEPNPPMFLKLTLFFVSLTLYAMYFTKASAAFMSTPLFLYVK